MVFGFFRKRDRQVPEALYRAIAVQAREVGFFGDGRFADTPTGRFDVLALHMFLFSRRMAGETDERAAGLSQDVFDIFTGELDSALRELGVGDTSVPKRKKRLVATFYTFAERLSGPLDTSDHAELANRLADFLFAGGTAHPSFPDRLAHYLQTASAGLAALPMETFLAGNVTWPDLTGMEG